jgi:hypothetical protein
MSVSQPRDAIWSKQVIFCIRYCLHMIQWWEVQRTYQCSIPSFPQLALLWIRNLPVSDLMMWRVYVERFRTQSSNDGAAAVNSFFALWYITATGPQCLNLMETFNNNNSISIQRRIKQHYASRRGWSPLQDVVSSNAEHCSTHQYNT